MLHAFDTVDHATLLAVLQRRFGIRGLALHWFTSYLIDRAQVFCMNGTESQPISVQCSVPQGSVLGPVKFIAYADEVSPIITSTQSDTISTFSFGWLFKDAVHN